MTSGLPERSESDSRLRPLMAEVAQAFHTHDVPYMVIGGQAVLLHGQVRMTKDIDFTTGISPVDYGRVVSALKAAGIEPMVDDVEEFVLRTHVLPSQTRRTKLRIDVSMTDSLYELQAMERADQVEIEGVSVRFATAEDLLIHKIIAWRGVDQQDVRGVLLKNPGVDLAYTRHWLSLFAEALEQPLLERLEQGIRDAGMVT